MTIVLIPLIIEYDGLKKALSLFELTCKPISEGKISGIYIENLNVIIAPAGNGKTAFQKSTQFFIKQFNPSLIICAGGGGALSKNLNIGDVVVGLKTVEFDDNDNSVTKEYTGDQTTIEKIKKLPSSKNVKIFYSIIASGEENIKDYPRAREIINLTNAVCTAWEGGAGGGVCETEGIPFLELRVVTDYADSRSAEDYKKNIKQVMASLAEILFDPYRGLFQE